MFVRQVPQQARDGCIKTIHRHGWNQIQVGTVRLKLYLIPAMSISRLDATISGLLWYLSLTYTTSAIPDCMTSFAHSLQGNSATYIVHPFTSAEFLFKMALSSAWQTVCSGHEYGLRIQTFTELCKIQLQNQLLRTGIQKSHDQHAPLVSL